MNTAIAIIAMLGLLACATPPEAPSSNPAPALTQVPIAMPAPVPTLGPVAEAPDAILLSLDTCRAVIVHIPYDPDYASQVVRTAAGADVLAYPMELTVEGGSPRMIDNVGQIVADCYGAIHNRE